MYPHATNATAHRLLRGIAFFLATVLLASCGGGGGGGGGPAPLQFDPGTVSLTMSEGEASWGTVRVIPDLSVLNGNIYAYLVDPDHRVIPSGGLSELGDGSYSTRIETVSSLTRGTYRGNISITLCRDAGCRQPYPGSPVLLPYVVTVSAAKPALTLASAPVPVSIPADRTGTLNYAVDVDARFSAPYYLSISDETGAIAFTSTLPYYPPAHIDVATTIPAGLTPGTYTGRLKVFLCYDQYCAGPRAVLPLYVPYSFTVLATSAHTPLSPVPGASDWETWQGNAAHTGYVPMTVDPAKIAIRWQWSGPNVDTGLRTDPVVTGDDRVYVASQSGIAAAGGTILALDERDGSVVWSKGSGTTDYYANINPLAVSGGNVYYVTHAYDASGTVMRSLEGSTGNPRFARSIYSQGQRWLAPVVRGGSVYTGGGYTGGAYGITTSTGDLAWFRGLSQVDLWTPAIDDNYAYTFTRSTFSALNLADGTVAYYINTPSLDWPFSHNTAPVIPAPGTVLVVNGMSGGVNQPNKLTSYNTATQAINWTVSGNFGSAPAVHDGVVYITDRVLQRVEARSVATGSVLWSWYGDKTLYFASMGTALWNVIVTDNAVLFSTETNTYVINRSNRSVMMSLPVAGSLSLSKNGILYITGRNDQVTAVNLK